MSSQQYPGPELRMYLLKRAIDRNDGVGHGKNAQNNL